MERNFLPPSTAGELFKGVLHADVTAPLTNLLQECCRHSEQPVSVPQLRLIGRCLRIIKQISSARISISKEHRAECCTTLIQLSIHPKVPLGTSSSLAATACHMMGGAKRVDSKTGELWFPKDFEVAWKPIYDRFDQVHVERKNCEAPMLDQSVLGHHRTIMLGLVRRARVFFQKDAAKEILNLVQGEMLGVSLLTLNKDNSTTGIQPGQDLIRWSILATFLPLETHSDVTVNTQILRSWTTVFWSRTPRSHSLWSPTCFDFFRRIAKAHSKLPSSSVTTTSTDELYQIWLHLLPTIFDRLRELVSSHLDHTSYKQTKNLKEIIGNPTTPKSSTTFLAYTNLDIAITKGCKLIGHIWEMSFQLQDDDETLVTNLLVQMFQQLAPAYHPTSNHSNFRKLSKLLKSMCTSVLECHYSKALSRSSSSSSKMMLASIARVAKATIPLALRLTYSRNMRVRQVGQQVVQSLSRIAPSLTSTALVLRMEEALSSVDSAHQAPSVLRSFAYAMKSILLIPSSESGEITRLSIFPRIIDLLRLSLPGLDANDTMKTIATISCFSQLFSWFPVGHNKNSPVIDDKVESFTEETIESLSRLNTGMDEFIPLLIDRIMVSIERIIYFSHSYI